MLAALLMACARQEPADEVVVVAPDPVDIARDTARVWGDTAADTAAPIEAVTDPPIGTTALDGTWTGSLDFLEVFTPGADPHVTGTVMLVIDGDAERHAVLRASATGWDPQVPLGRAYGELTGIGLGTLDPTDLSTFRMDITFGAPNKAVYTKINARVRAIDDTLTMNIDDVVGIGALQVGHVITWTVTRAP
jgi:hypothetical protein